MNLLHFALITWWLCGMWWLGQQADGKQVAEIRPDWCRYCAVILTFPAFWVAWIVIHSITVTCFTARQLWDAARTFGNSIAGVKQEECK